MNKPLIDQQFRKDKPEQKKIHKPDYAGPSIKDYCDGKQVKTDSHDPFFDNK